MSRRTWYARQAEKRRAAPYYSRDYCPVCGKEWPECGHLTRGGEPK
jgi:formate dehydrogenase maturation protein FdhE